MVLDCADEASQRLVPGHRLHHPYCGSVVYRSICDPLFKQSFYEGKIYFQYFKIDLILNNIYLLLAPGSYEVEKSEKNVIQSTSAYSFGLKYKDQKTDDIPGKQNLII